MSLTVSIRTVSGATSSLNVEPTITIAELRTAITEQCGLGFCTTLVFKGQPLKKDTVTLASTNYSAGDTLVGVFKKEAPKAAAAPAPVTPVVAAPTAADLQTPVKAPAPAAAAAAPKPVERDTSIYQSDWECPTCTYINIGARTICEMCMTEDPAKAKAKKPAAGGQQQERPQVDQNLVNAQLQTIPGYDEMDEATQMAVREMIEDDLAMGGDAGAMGDGAEGVNLDDYLAMLDQNPEQRAAFCQELGLPATATTQELSDAVKARTAQQNGLDREALMQQMMSDPQIAAQLQTLLAQHRDDPEALQEALLQILTEGMMMGDEDDEDVEFDDEAMADE